MGSAIATVSQLTGVPPGRIGCSLYIKQQCWRRPRLRLLRAERVRLIDSRSESGICFTPGTGAVGKCWNTTHPTHHDWIGLNTAWAESPPAESEWQALGPSETHGFSFDDWQVMLGRYAEVLAVILTSGDRKLGVLTVDIIDDRSGVSDGQRMNDAAVKEAVQVVAQRLKDHL